MLRRVCLVQFASVAACCLFAVSAVGATLRLPAYSQDTTKRGTDTLSYIVVNGSGPLSERNSRFSPGTHVHRFDDIPQASSITSLGDILKKETTLYIKEYGRGMSSYISVRGTSSSHTSIDWNGESFSMPTMGQADLSHIPLYFFDNLSLNLGGGSTLYGNGSIGGNIQLEINPQFADQAGMVAASDTSEHGLQLTGGDITIKGGSYETFFTGATAKYASRRWAGRTALYWNGANNAFSFENNTKPGHPSERQNNAQFSNWGVYQQVAHRFKNSSDLILDLMHLDFYRHIQPSVANNDNPVSWHTIADRNTKVSLKWRGTTGEDGRYESVWRYNAGISYNRDYEHYEGDVIASDRYTASAGAEWERGKWRVKAGGRCEYIKPEVESYGSGTYEWRSELYALAFWRPLNSLSIGGGLRGSFVTGTTIPVQPVLNAKYTPFPWLAFRASASKSTKVPTLNDKYWGGVNAYLKPEKGTTYEGGADFSSIVGKWSLSAFATYYNTIVEDWIRWLPAGEVWRPKNIPKVRSNGVECGFSASGVYGNTTIKVNGGYSYTDVKKLESYLAGDPSVGRQLAYQPYHIANLSVGVSWRKWETIIGYGYTGERTTTDMFDYLDPYSLLDLSLLREVSIFSKSCSLCAELKNILNSSYQNVKFYAMPGINFMISARIML